MFESFVILCIITINELDWLNEPIKIGIYNIFDMISKSTKYIKLGRTFYNFV